MFASTRLVFILLIGVLGCCTTVQAQVTITSITPTTVCAGSSITVSFTNSDAERSSFSLYLYPAQSTDSLALNQDTYISGDGSLYGLIPPNQSIGSYRVGIKKVSSNGILRITKSNSFFISAVPPAPTVGANPVVYCQYSSIGPLTATTASGGELYWYSSPTGGIGTHSSIFPQTAVAGTTVYYVSQIINGCESPRSSIVVLVIPRPSPPSVNPVTYCQGSPPTALTVTADYRSALNWYTVPTGGFASPSITPSTSVTGTTTFYFCQVGNGCESPRAALSVAIKPRPAIAITADELTLTPNHASILLTATPSTASLVWSTGDTTSSILVKVPDVYSVSAKDANGCTATSDVLIDQSPVDVLYSLKAGDWNDPSVWSTNQIPTNAYAVRLHHVVNVPAGYQAQVLALRYRLGGQIQLNMGSYIKTGP